MPSVKRGCPHAWPRQTKPASVMAEALGVPRKTLYRWLAATRPHPDEPFGGRGQLRANNQPVRAPPRRLPVREAGMQSYKQRCCTNGQRQPSGSFTATASPARSGMARIQ